MHLRTTDIDISSVEFWSKTFDERENVFARLRAEAPVSWHDPLETPGLPPSEHGEAGFWAVTKAADIRHISRHPEVYSSELGQVSLRPVPYRLRPNLLVMDPPQHTRHRKIISSAFTPASLARLEAQIAARAARIVDEIAGGGELDFVKAVSGKLPLSTVADMIGVPPSEHERFVVAGDAFVGSELPDLPDGVDIEAFFAGQVAYLRALFLDLAAMRRRKPVEDLMSYVVQAEIDGRRLTDDEVISPMLLLVVAGDDTTKQTTTLTQLALARHPDQREWLAGDFDARIGSAVEEFVRFASPIVVFARTARSDTVLRGVKIAAGDKVGLFYCSGNRDEEVFPAPHRFDLSRPTGQHVAFGGGGAHHCLGAGVARLQLRHLFDQLLRKVPVIEVGEPEYVVSEFVHGIRRLPVRIP